MVGFGDFVGVDIAPVSKKTAVKWMVPNAAVYKIMTISNPYVLVY